MTIYTITYPSGCHFTATGRFSRQPFGSELVPIIEVDLPGCDIVALDPRAIIRDGERVIYSPQMNRDGLSTEMRSWCDAHPDLDERCDVRSK